MDRKVNVPKILCHSDGAVFANWHGSKPVYAAYISDEDTPPSPESLKITGYVPEGLRWCPLVQIVQVGAPGEVEIGGPYVDGTGELV